MTFPVLEESVNDGSTSNETSLVVSMPASVDAGNWLVCIIRHGQQGGAAPTGWTALVTGTDFSIYYKKADGTEGGTTVTFTTNSGTAWASKVFRISGGHATSAPEISTLASATSANPNSGSLTPSWGADDTLFLDVIGFGHIFGTSRTVSSAPTNYTISGTTSDQRPAFAQLAAAGASRQLNASSDDPGNWTLSGSADWRAYLIGIRPAGAVANTRRYSLGLTGVG